MADWVSELNNLGVIDWFGSLDDDEKAPMAINLLAQHLLGDVKKYLPHSAFTAEIIWAFESDDFGTDWYTLITKAHYQPPKGYLYLEDIMYRLLEKQESLQIVQEPCFDDGQYPSSNELEWAINDYYLSWHRSCLKAFNTALNY